MKPVVYLLFIVMLSGCMVVRYSNRSADELRTEKYFVETWREEKSLIDIAHNIYMFSTKCGNIATATLDPKNKKYGIVKIEVPGWSAGNVILMIEFNETSENSTSITAWDENKSSFWVSRYKKAIADPAHCE
ncbi:hypothetical protein RVX_R15220 [Nitratidesulfovibrio sp. HK-II]|uniref:hypothetical protein n=1 Tax=Nitratidesulfovibrio sp. HK-II TaxID=2009266 RepID=UPI0011C03144|nr:hypothetical protein [Nitratidesulfovibrio sp. HK-II]